MRDLPSSLWVIPRFLVNRAIEVDQPFLCLKSSALRGLTQAFSASISPAKSKKQQYSPKIL
jgi:hypothetical protein